MRDALPHPAIKHVVVLMLENRGFDHVMGWLYEKDDTPHIDTRAGDQRPFLGLSTLSPQQLAALANPLPDNAGTALPVRGARSPRTPSYNPGESFHHIMNQMWGYAPPGDPKAPATSPWKDPALRALMITERSQGGRLPPMTGYVQDYQAAIAHQSEGWIGQAVEHTKGRDPVDPTEILDTYTPEQLPVLSGLARHYAVSDEWYCSVPSQTNTNRAFAMAGTSRGMVNNSFYDPYASTWNPLTGALKKAAEGISNADALPVSTRSLFEVLQQFGLSWKVYWQSTWPPRATTTTASQYLRTMLPLLGGNCFDPHFVQFSGADDHGTFFADARAGRLPAFTWIEPEWGGGPYWSHPVRSTTGNDMHPVCDTTVAEDFVARVYNALSDGKAWHDTLLVITFDENGGTYDHLPPPVALPSGNDRVPLPQPSPGGSHGMDAQTRTQFGFDFGQYGARVPTLLVSPRVRPGTVFRSRTEVPFDHTSLIATVLSMAGIDKRHWQLGKRVSKAPTFHHLLDGEASQARPGRALATGTRRQTPVLLYNTDYRLEYCGTAGQGPSVKQAPPRFLGPSEQGSLQSLLYYYPTLTGDAGQAIRIRFVPEGGGDAVGPVLNLAVLLIVSAESSWFGFTRLCIGPAAPSAYYSRTVDDGAKWQVRILSSRDPQQEVRIDDRLFFVSRLKAPGQDRLQRLMPSPKDPRYLTTRAGEWALWRIAPAKDL
jgi:phospholipase C